MIGSSIGSASSTFPLEGEVTLERSEGSRLFGSAETHKIITAMFQVKAGDSPVVLLKCDMDFIDQFLREKKLDKFKIESLSATTCMVYEDHSLKKALEIKTIFEEITLQHSPKPKYRYIDPSEAYGVDKAILTIVRGDRPIAFLECSSDFDHPFLIAAKQLDGIEVMPVSEEGCIMYRDDNYELALELKSAHHEINERASLEGADRFLAYKRILDTCRNFGRLFNYKPEKIEEFYNKIARLYNQHIESS